MTTKDTLAPWREEALALDAQDYKPRKPIFVLIGEAHDLAAQTRRRWKTKRDRKNQIIERGLDLAGQKLPAKIEQELVSLGDALQQSHSAYVLTTGPSTTTKLVVEAEHLVSEISAVLEYHFDDGVQDSRDEQLASVHTEHADDPSTPDALATELSDYVALASPHREEIDGLGGFDAADIDHAVALARTLRELPVDALASAEGEATRSALDLRNRVAFLLQQRMNQVRSAARFVFRDQPDTARLFTSTYERRKRAASRRAKAKQGDAQPVPALQGASSGPPYTLCLVPRGDASPPSGSALQPRPLSPAHMTLAADRQRPLAVPFCPDNPAGCLPADDSDRRLFT